MKQIIALLLTAVLMLTAGCTGDSSTQQPDPTVWVSYQSSQGKTVSDLGAAIFQFSYQQPVLSGGSGAITVINNKLDNATSAFLYGSGGVQELTEMARMDCNESWFTCYALSRTVHVARADSAVISFRYVDYAFTGGVHGYTAEYGLTYDMNTGEQLTLSSLTDDQQSLTDFCRGYILEQLQSEAYSEIALLPNYEKALDTVLTNWILTDRGLQFIAQPYVMAAYSAGTLRFTVPYAQLRTYLKTQWIPVDRGHGGGTLTISSGTADQSFVLAPEGDNVVIRINGTVYDLSVESVGSYRSGEAYTYYISGQELYSPEAGSMSLGLQIAPLGSRPTTMIRYRSGDGTEHQYYITQDGKLTEADPYLIRQ